MLKRIYSKAAGRVSANTVAGISAAVILAAAVILLAANLFTPKASAYINDGGVMTTVGTNSDSIDEFIAEQRAKLHPFDMITYAGYGEDGSYEIAVERAPAVTISDGRLSKAVRALKGETVEELLSREGVALEYCDSVVPEQTERIVGDCDIIITRGFPVEITSDGEKRTVLASGMTVGELLVREHISLGASDVLNVSTEDAIYEEMEIEVTRITYETRVKSTFIPYETEYEDTPNLKTGTEELVTAGVDGSLTITIQDKYVNGEKVSSEVTESSRVEPVNERIIRGTAVNVPYSTREGSFTLEDGVPTEYAFVLSGKVTAYTAPRGTTGTYSGRPLVIGSIGVDPDVIPFGSEVYIMSKDGSHVYGYAIASDTGDIKGTGIIADAYMGTTEDNYDDACDWGAQDAYVYVLSVGDNSVSWQ